MSMGGGRFVPSAKIRVSRAYVKLLRLRHVAPRPYSRLTGGAPREADRGFLRRYEGERTWRKELRQQHYCRLNCAAGNII